MKPMREWNGGDTEPAMFALFVLALIFIIAVIVGVQFPNGPSHPERSIYSKPQ